MSHTVISVENLSKRYLVGHKSGGGEARYLVLRDVVGREIREIGRKTVNMLRGRQIVQGNRVEEFWALRDVSFEVKEGEVVGIIGRNGAGKSTLLKILSRITEPTEGRIVLRGRVASLLEVGTGFHPELTGRENIYLNGAILGMTRAEIRRKFDEIVAFAEFERFLDTPVKRYSSGMYVRLAFAVAAHLEPEILMVDEVLAVGDAAFQKKCLGKMNDVAHQGRTVIFVSHNLSAVQTLCKRAILLIDGAVASDGMASAIVAKYLKVLYKSSIISVADRSDRKGRGTIELIELRVCGDRGFESVTLATGRPARFIFRLSDARSRIACSFTIYDQLGQPVTYFDSATHGLEGAGEAMPTAEFTCDIDELLLLPGRYYVNVGITWNAELQDHLEGAAFLEVEEGIVRGLPITLVEGYGNVHIPHRWSIKS
jgi:lipopolysaccharide transport system ATP-binding protein